MLIYCRDSETANGFPVKTVSSVSERERERREREREREQGKEGVTLLGLVLIVIWEPLDACQMREGECRTPRR